MTDWNPDQYEKFKNERAKPFFDLMDLVDSSVRISCAVDLGCGTGELTAQLVKKFKIQKLLALDNSDAMLKKSTSYANENLTFKKIDIGSFEPNRKFALIFSNAALQWIPHHEILFPKLISWLNKESGQLCVQMPSNYNHPSHKIASEVAVKMFPKKFAYPFRSNVLPIERYSEILNECGLQKQVCRMQIYGNQMSSVREVVEWTKGSTLNEYKSKLTNSEFEMFLKEYEDQLIRQIGETPYFYTFKRIFLWGMFN